MSVLIKRHLSSCSLLFDFFSRITDVRSRLRASSWLHNAVNSRKNQSNKKFGISKCLYSTKTKSQPRMGFGGAKASGFNHQRFRDPTTLRFPLQLLHIARFQPSANSKYSSCCVFFGTLGRASGLPENDFVASTRLGRVGSTLCQHRFTSFN